MIRKPEIVMYILRIIEIPLGRFVFHIILYFQFVSTSFRIYEHSNYLYLNIYFNSISI